MITQQELENLGFVVISDRRSSYTGHLTDFYKKFDNGHIIEGHDTTELFLTKDVMDITIRRSHESSWNYTDKELVFKGRCGDIELLKQIIAAVQ